MLYNILMNNKIKQLLIAHINFAKGFRGGEMQTLLLIEYFSSRGYNQIVGIRDTNKLFLNRLQKIENLTIIKIKSPFIFSAKEFKDCDFIYSHEPKASQLAFVINLRYNTPYTLTKRVDMPTKDNFFNRLLYKRAKYVIAISSAVKKRVQQITKNVEVIHDCFNPLDINRDRVLLLKDRFKDKFIIGNIAALDMKKGQRIIVEVARKLQELYPDIHFLLLGDGEDKEYLLNQSKDLKNIIFEGYVVDVNNYIEVFDLFVFPSYTEGFGSILLDVSNSNVPIVASRVGGIVDIIEDNFNGLLLDKIESNELKDKIMQLYHDKKTRDRLSNNAKLNVEKFSIENMGKEYEELLS